MELENKAISPDEAATIITAAKSYCYNQSVNDKWSLYFRVLWQTGLREAEALQISKAEIFPDHLIVHRSKKGHPVEDIIWIQPGLYSELIQYIITYRIRGKLFNNAPRTAQYIFAKLKEKTGIRPHLTVHGFRHGFAFNFIATVGASHENSADTLIALQRWLSHENITTTQRYFKKGLKDLKIDLSRLKF